MTKRILIYSFLCVLLSMQAFAQPAPQTYRGNKHGEIMGSGGMNYRYDKRTGRYTQGENMRKHFFGIWADGNYSAIWNNLSNVTITPGGYALSAGLCYEYEHFDQFKINTGVGVRWQTVANDVLRRVVFDDNAVVDKAGYPYTLVYDFYDRRDYVQTLYLQVPLLFGQRFGNIDAYKGSLYYLAGLKAQLAVISTTAVRVTGTTVGVYDQYLGLGEGNIFTEMDNHGLRHDVPMYTEGEALFKQWQFDLLLSCEIGYEHGFGRNKYQNNTPISENTDARMRWAFFADWGMRDQNPRLERDLCYIPPQYKWDFTEFQFNHIFATDNAKGKQLHNFFVGIKLTILFGWSHTKQCVLCGEYQSEQSYK